MFLFVGQKDGSLLFSSQVTEEWLEPRLSDDWAQVYKIDGGSGTLVPMQEYTFQLIDDDLNMLHKTTGKLLMALPNQLEVLV